MFQQVKASSVSRGSFFKLFSTRARMVKYLGVIAIGLPIWYVVGILVTFSPEFGAAMSPLVDGGQLPGPVAVAGDQGDPGDRQGQDDHDGRRPPRLRGPAGPPRPSCASESWGAARGAARWVRS